ncbi:MAG: hypothetical protein HDR18_09215 [Lachnospiraceae bacterium]|nr:hypothetical protein [Lachnospiraceae bacterium]
MATIIEGMLSICMVNSELETERHFHTGMMQYWLRQLHFLKSSYSIGKRAHKMLMRDPWEFLGIAPC